VRSAADDYLLRCLPEVALEQEVNSAVTGQSPHPGLKVHAGGRRRTPATCFSVVLTQSRGPLLSRGFPTAHAARCAAVRLAEAADWRLPESEFGAQHHAAVLAEETRPALTAFRPDSPRLTAVPPTARGEFTMTRTAVRYHVSLTEHHGRVFSARVRPRHGLAGQAPDLPDADAGR
jgi:hypothetical protein